MSLEKASSLSQMLTEMKCSAFNTCIIIGIGFISLGRPAGYRSLTLTLSHTHTHSHAYTCRSTVYRDVQNYQSHTFIFMGVGKMSWKVLILQANYRTNYSPECATLWATGRQPQYPQRWDSVSWLKSSQFWQFWQVLRRLRSTPRLSNPILLILSLRHMN